MAFAPKKQKYGKDSSEMLAIPKEMGKFAEEALAPKMKMGEEEEEDSEEDEMEDEMEGEGKMKKGGHPTTNIKITLLLDKSKVKGK